MSNQTVNIDIGGYLKAKAAGTAKIVNVEGSVYYSRRVFDPHTGAPEPQLIPLTREAIEGSLANARESVKVLEAVVRDFDAAAKGGKGGGK